MSLSLRWVGEDEFDQVGETRAWCYSPAQRDVAANQKRVRDDGRAVAGDFMLALRDGQAVGTITSLSFEMWARGKAVPCQGIAFVGTIKTHRRGGRGKQRGIASQLMDEALKLARERGQIISTLMPFRASYYEHFGFGMIDRRNIWTVPLSILPSGDFEGVRMMRPADLPAIKTLYNNVVKRGQCDLMRGDAAWAYWAQQWDGGFCVVDEQPGGAIVSWMYIADAPLERGGTAIRVVDAVADSSAAFQRQLHFLSSLRDQYSAAILELQADFPLHWLLKEPQLPHRRVEHAIASVLTQNRLQARILDHVKFLDGQQLQSTLSGQLTVAVREVEETTSTFKIELNHGRVSAGTSSQTPEIELPARVWSAIACGDLSAGFAARTGLLKSGNEKAVLLLESFASGPAPYCNERF